MKRFAVIAPLVPVVIFGGLYVAYRRRPVGTVFAIFTIAQTISDWMP